MEISSVLYTISPFSQPIISERSNALAWQKYSDSLYKCFEAKRLQVSGSPLLLNGIALFSQFGLYTTTFSLPSHSGIRHLFK